MAAQPTPRVMPTKNFPSRVNFSFRGGRMRDSPSRNRDGGFTSALASLIGSAIPRTRREKKRSERHGHARDDVAHGRFGLVARGNEAVGVGREADAVREDGHREI